MIIAPQILDLFPHLDLTKYQSLIYSSLVLPQLVRLPQECIQYPTPLLKLLLVWSKHEQ